MDYGRVFCEDLGGNYSNREDFDYNDVVFDATLANEWLASENANKLVAHITLRAAGGVKDTNISIDPEVVKMRKMNYLKH